MSSTALYKAFIEVGASEDSATRAAEDVIQVSQLPQLATKADLMATEAGLKSEIGTLRNEVGTEAKSERSVRSEIAILRSDMTAAMANQETRLIKWMVGSLFVFAGIIIASVGILFQTLLSPGVVQ